MTEYRENKDVRRPFASTPDARVFFPAAPHEQTRLAALRCLQRGEGIAVVVGAPGVGKTLLARKIASEFETNDLVAVVTARRRTSAKSFLQQTLFGLRQTFVGADETELRLMTRDYLERTSHERFALLVDDAQNLSLRACEEIAAMIDAASPRVQTSVALFGSDALEERLNLPELSRFQQRVVLRSYLEPFSEDEIARYVEAELARVSATAFFSPDAIAALAARSGGLPRVLAQLCDRAFFLATSNAAGQDGAELVVEERDVETAWRDLQNIPSPSPHDSTFAASSDAPSSDVVEFGDLEDDEDDENASSDATPERGELLASDENDANVENAENADNADNAENVENVENVENARVEESFDPIAALDEEMQDLEETEAEEEEEMSDYKIDSELDARLRAQFSTPRRRVSDATFAPAPDEGESSGRYDASLSFDAQDVATYAPNPNATRRPIENGDDGSKEYRKANGFNAEDAARFAADDRHLESQFARLREDSSLRRMSEEAPRSLEDRAYRQIVASCCRSVSDFPASDQYLNELRLLEQEIAEEANLIRRIRSIHMQLRSARDPFASRSEDELDAFADAK